MQLSILVDARDSLAAARAVKSNIHEIDFFSLPLGVKLLATVIDHREVDRKTETFPPASWPADQRRDCRLCHRDSQLSNPICPAERQARDGQGERKGGKRWKKVGGTGQRSKIEKMTRRTTWKWIEKELATPELTLVRPAR